MISTFSKLIGYLGLFSITLAVAACFASFNPILGVFALFVMLFCM